MEEDSVSFSRRMVRQKRSESTKSQYSSGIGMLNAWLERKHPEVIVNSKIILPLEKSVLEEYFGEASKTSNNKLKSVSALNGYRNSIYVH
jgi:hypothetical protein